MKMLFPEFVRLFENMGLRIVEDTGTDLVYRRALSENPPYNSYVYLTVQSRFTNYASGYIQTKDGKRINGLNIEFKKSIGIDEIELIFREILSELRVGEYWGTQTKVIPSTRSPQKTPEESKKITSATNQTVKIVTPPPGSNSDGNGWIPMDEDGWCNIEDDPVLREQNAAPRIRKASSAQLAWLAREGYDTMNTHYSFSEALDIIRSFKASRFEMQYLKEHGYDVTKAYTKGQYSDAKKEIEANLKRGRADSKFKNSPFKGLK